MRILILLEEDSKFAVKFAPFYVYPFFAFLCYSNLVMQSNNRESELQFSQFSHYVYHLLRVTIFMPTPAMIGLVILPQSRLCSSLGRARSMLLSLIQ